MWVSVAVWQPCELLYTCYLLTWTISWYLPSDQLLRQNPTFCVFLLEHHHNSSQVVAVNVYFADEHCKELLMDCESLAETSASAERCGNIGQAIANCQQATGLLTFAYFFNCSHRIKMSFTVINKNGETWFKLVACNHDASEWMFFWYRLTTLDKVLLNGFLLSLLPIVLWKSVNL